MVSQDIWADVLKSRKQRQQAGAQKGGQSGSPPFAIAPSSPLEERLANSAEAMTQLTPKQEKLRTAQTRLRRNLQSTTGVTEQPLQPRVIPEQGQSPLAALNPLEGLKGMGEQIVAGARQYTLPRRAYVPPPAPTTAGQASGRNFIALLSLGALGEPPEPSSFFPLGTDISFADAVLQSADALLPSAPTVVRGFRNGRVPAVLGERASQSPVLRRLVAEETGEVSVAGSPTLPKSVPQVVPPPASSNVLGLRPIQTGLTRTEQALNVARRTVGRPFNAVEDDPLVSAAFRERQRAAIVSESKAAQLGAQSDDLAKNAFEMDEAGRVPTLAGFDPDITGAPTIQHIAARYPLYERVLTPTQKETMEWLRANVGPYKQMWDDLGIEVGQRPDIIDGGFYLPRGRAGLEGADAPFKVSGGRGRGGKSSAEKATAFTFQDEGIAKGYQYAPLGEAIQSYAQESGRRAIDAHISNFFKNYVDPVTGEKIAQTAADRVPQGLRTQVEKLRNQIRTRRMTLVSQRSRERTLERETERAANRAKGAQQRASSAANRAFMAEQEFSPEELAEVRVDVQSAIEEGRELQRRIGENNIRLQQSRSVLSDQERKLLKEVEELEGELKHAEAQIGEDRVQYTRNRLAGAGGPADPAVGFGLTRTLDSLQRRIDRMTDRAIAMSERVDGLMEKGTILRDMDKASRDGLVNARRAERALIDNQRALASVERELRLLKREEQRAMKVGADAAKRENLAERDILITSQEYDQLSDSLRDIQAEWQHALRRSRQTPRDQSLINLKGLEGYSFADEIANAANKILREQGEPTGEFSGVVRIANASQSLLLGMKATLDNSVMGIQGLLGLADDQVAYGRAMKVNAKAWLAGGDRALGSFINDFDRRAIPQGRLSAGDWARHELRIGGKATDFQIGGTRLLDKVGDLPGVRNANRAFGYTGDALRLAWADDLLAQEIGKGRTLQDVITSGDMGRIAREANEMTGWTGQKAFGSMGDLLLFAPRFMQARLQVVAKAAVSLRPGAPLDQRLARRSMMRMIGYGTVMTVVINEALGNETDFRPFTDKDGKPSFTPSFRGGKNTNFMRIRWAGRDWSVFGPYDSLLGIVVAIGQGNPDGALRQVASPLLSIGWDLKTGRDFQGNAIYDSPENFAKWAFNQFIPIGAGDVPQAGARAIEGIQEGDAGKIVQGGVSIAGVLAGGKSSPLSIRDMKDEEAKRRFGKTYDGLNEGQQAEVDETPLIQERIQQLPDPAIGMEEQVRIAFDSMRERNAQLDQTLAQALQANPTGEARRKLIQDWKGNRYQNSQATITGAVEQELAKKKDKKRPVEDVLADRYWSAEAPLNPRTGEPDFDAQETVRDGILTVAKSMGVDARYITGDGAGTYRAKRFKDTPESVKLAVQEYERDMEKLAPYWEIGATPEFAPTLLRPLWRQYLAEPDDRKKQAMERQYPALRTLLKRKTEQRQQLREKNPSIDVTLLKWGYSTSARTPAGRLYLSRRAR